MDNFDELGVNYVTFLLSNVTKFTVKFQNLYFIKLVTNKP